MIKLSSRDWNSASEIKMYSSIKSDLKWLALAYYNTKICLTHYSHTISLLRWYIEEEEVESPTDPSSKLTGLSDIYSPWEKDDSSLLNVSSIIRGEFYLTIWLYGMRESMNINLSSVQAILVYVSFPVSLWILSPVNSYTTFPDIFPKCAHYQASFLLFSLSNSARPNSLNFLFS